MRKITLLVGFALLIHSCSSDDTTIETQQQEQEIAATCSDGIQNGDETEIDCGGSCEPCITSLVVEGKAQKGPFINGSVILLSELDASFSPTGNVFTSEILENTGSFSFGELNLISPNVSLRVNGFYFNEVCGALSSAPIILQGIASLTAGNPANLLESQINLNVLTHLEKSRIEYLLENGTSFLQAKSQAQNEILQIFEIAIAGGIEASELLDISGSSSGDAALIAVSSILQGFRTESEFSSIMADIISDIRTDGSLDNPVIGANLVAHAKLLDAAVITSYIEDRYEDLGIEVTVPNFGQYISNFIENTDFEELDTVITYQENGVNGTNLLDIETIEIPSNTFVSLAAELPVDCMDLTIKISAANGTFCEFGCWVYSVSSIVNWDIDIYDQSTDSQTFNSTDTNLDLGMIFENGTFLIAYFENNSSTPTRTKTLIAN